MQTPAIRPLQRDDGDWLDSVLAQAFGAPAQVVHGVRHEPRELQGFVAVHGRDRVGALTYQIAGDGCEIVTINSLEPGSGIGPLLLEAVREEAQRAGSRRLWLVTTNDNLEALRFFQQHGFAMVALHRDAVTRARALKPEIPLVAENGIPIRDELELEQRLANA